MKWKWMYVAIATMWIIGTILVMPFLSFDPVGDSANKKCVLSLDGDSPIYFASASVLIFFSVLLTLMVTYSWVLRVSKKPATYVSSISLGSASSSSHGTQTPQITQ